MGKVLKLPEKIISAVPLIGKPVAGIVSKVTDPLNESLLGTPVAATPNEIIDMSSPTGRAAQEQLIAQYSKGIGADMSGIAQQQSAAQENQIMQNAADQTMRAEQLVAQRGLGRTASGIGAILNQQKGVNDLISANRAALPGLQEQLRRDSLNFATGGINQILGEQGQSKALKFGEVATRSGGLAPLVGAAVGGKLGGAEGAKVGLSAGQYLQNSRQ